MSRRSRSKEKKLARRNKQEHDTVHEIAGIIKYLGLDEATPNTGTRNKRDLMKRALTLLKTWESGTPEEWSNRLSLRLNISARTAKDNYIEPLIQEGIIQKENSRLVFYGVPSGIKKKTQSERE